MIDVFDVLVLLGVVILGVAVFLAWGPVAAVAYVGAILATIGIVGAILRGRKV